MKLMTRKEIESVAGGIACDLQSNKYSKIGFIGPLGAGKTTLIKEILSSLGVKDATASPTFTLLREYESARGSICHIDLYRIDSRDNETIDMIIGAINSNRFSLVEWVDKSDKISVMMDVVYTLEYSNKEDVRSVKRLLGRRSCAKRGGISPSRLDYESAEANRSTSVSTVIARNDTKQGVKILRFDTDNHKINAYLYIDGDLKWRGEAETMANLSIDKSTFSDLSGIYVYRGPGGYSKLRSIWAFALGLSLSGTPIHGYKEWETGWSHSIPKNTDHSIIYGQEII